MKFAPAVIAWKYHAGRKVHFLQCLQPVRYLPRSVSLLYYFCRIIINQQLYYELVNIDHRRVF